MFDGLCVISRMHSDIFPNVHALHDLKHQRFISIDIRARFAQYGTSKISFYQYL